MSNIKKKKYDLDLRLYLDMTKTLKNYRIERTIHIIKSNTITDKKETINRLNLQIDKLIKRLQIRLKIQNLDIFIKNKTKIYSYSS